MGLEGYLVRSLRRYPDRVAFHKSLDLDRLWRRGMVEELGVLVRGRNILFRLVCIVHRHSAWLNSEIACILSSSILGRYPRILISPLSSHWSRVQGRLCIP